MLIQLLLPVTGTAGPNAMALFAETRRELADRFNGLTAYVRSPAKGLWTAPDGHVEQDDVIMVEVVTAEFDAEWWRAVRGRARQPLSSRDRAHPCVVHSDAGR